MLPRLDWAKIKGESTAIYSSKVVM